MEKERPLPRITGTEMEWGGMVTGAEDPNKLLQVNDRDLHPIIAEYLNTNGIARIGHVGSCFLGNGSRFYQDVRERREYATPEDDSFIGTTANEIVNDQIMSGIAEIYEKKNKRPVSFTKRVIDDDFIGCGYHISYAGNAERVQINEDSLALFGVFAATRSVLFGAGALLPGGLFATGQKALTLNTDYSGGTVDTKPVINLRSEPHADPTRFIRLHDTSADPNVSPWATRMKLGTGSLVLRLLENDKTFPNLRFKDPLFIVANTVALDSKLSEPLRLKNGRTMYALEVQKYLMLQSKLLSNRVNLSDEELWTIDEWDRAIHDLGRDPMTTCDRIEWTMRRKVLSRSQEKHGWAWDSQILRYKDRQFSEMAVAGIATALRETAWAKYMPPESLIRERMKQPPQTTRASIRGAFIKDLQKSDKPHVSVGWSTINFYGQNYQLPDPYTTTDYEISNLLAS